MSAVAPRMVNDVSYVSRINHESQCSRHAQYLVKWRVALVAPRIVAGVSYVKRTNRKSDFSWQAQGVV